MLLINLLIDEQLDELKILFLQLYTNINFCKLASRIYFFIFEMHDFF
jgi:hypothetical protein